VTVQTFTLDWMGGSVERRFRKRRKAHCIDDFPWETLRVDDFPPEIAVQAQASWTEGAFAEYCTGASFAALSRALLEAQAPIDLVGMCGDFVADEMLHVELNARMAMRCGGAAPRSVNFGDLVPTCATGLSPLHYAVELAVRVGVAEAAAAPVLAALADTMDQPLVRCVIHQIARDEAPHGLLVWRVLDWAAPRLTHGDRVRLGVVARESLADMQQMQRSVAQQSWHGLCSTTMRAAGWLEPSRYVEVLDRARVERVWDHLAHFEIVPP
jgi:hypothetical protein